MPHAFRVLCWAYSVPSWSLLRHCFFKEVSLGAFTPALEGRLPGHIVLLCSDSWLIFSEGFIIKLNRTFKNHTPAFVPWPMKTHADGTWGLGGPERSRQEVRTVPSDEATMLRLWW